MTILLHMPHEYYLLQDGERVKFVVGKSTFKSRLLHAKFHPKLSQVRTLGLYLHGYTRYVGL